MDNPLPLYNQQSDESMTNASPSSDEALAGNDDTSFQEALNSDTDTSCSSEEDEVLNSEIGNQSSLKKGSSYSPQKSKEVLMN